MKYVLLIYDNPEARETFFGEKTDELMGEVDALIKELTESGELIGTQALADPSDDAEVEGLLALMLLTDARSPARTRPDGALVPLAEQDRDLWDQEAIREKVALVSDALAQGSTGPYQLQAAIAAVHDEAERAEDTDWPQILSLYELLKRITDNPVITLNRAVAVAMVRGLRAGLEVLKTLDADEQLTDHHRLDAVRAHLLEMAGDHAAARCCYRTAARHTTSLPERRYLGARAARLAENEQNSAPSA